MAGAALADRPCTLACRVPGVRGVPCVCGVPCVHGVPGVYGVPCVYGVPGVSRIPCSWEVTLPARSPTCGADRPVRLLGLRADRYQVRANSYVRFISNIWKKNL